MSSSHMKRLTMPRSWPLQERLQFGFRSQILVGILDLCMPMELILRDVLGVAQNRRGLKILHSKLSRSTDQLKLILEGEWG